jgi:hypothetical protein
MIEPGLISGLDCQQILACFAVFLCHDYQESAWFELLGEGKGKSFPFADVSRVERREGVFHICRAIDLDDQINLRVGTGSKNALKRRTGATRVGV